VKEIEGPVSGTFTGPPPPGVSRIEPKKPYRITGTTRDPDTGDVHVAVVDEEGNPRENVRVRVSAKGKSGQFEITHEAVVGNDGRTELEGVRPGRVYLWLNAGRAQHHLRIPVEAGRITEVDAVFPIGVTVVGTVRDVDKGPLAAITVRVELGTHGSEGSFSATTSSEGRFRLEGVPEGTHRVALTGRSIGYHPRAKAKIVITGDDDPVEHDFVLGLIGIQGTVRDAATGDPLPGTMVSVAGLHADATTDAAGRYELEDIPFGTYRVGFVRGGYARVLSGEIEVREGVPTTLDVDLESAATVTFRLRTEAGEGVLCVAWVDFAVVAGADGKHTSPRLETDAEGIGHCRSVMPGTYTVSLRMEGYAADEQRLVVRAGENRCDVVVTPKAFDAPPALRGVVRDSVTRDPVVEVRVSCQTAGGDPSVTNSAGEYVFQEMIPGKHRLIFSKDGYGILFVHGVEVKAGETTTRDIDLDPAATLHLHITDAKGDPVVGRHVLAITPKRGTTGTSVGTGVTADASGHAVYRRIVPGSYKLSVIAEGKGRGEVEAEILLGDNTVYVRLE
jgi:hypothetical protein